MRTCHLVDLGLVPYVSALTLQRQLATLRAERRLGDIFLIGQHLPVVTLGRSGRKVHLRVPESSLAAMGVEYFEVERGGDMTYHGPGQLVGYPILNLADHGRDVHRYLRQLEAILIAALSEFGIAACRSVGRTGVWVGECKIASLGIHVGRWVTRHGFALNIDIDLTPFDLIVPCGIQGVKMTSMARELSRPISVDDVAAVLTEHFESAFLVSLVPMSLTDIGVTCCSGTRERDNAAVVGGMH